MGYKDDEQGCPNPLRFFFHPRLVKTVLNAMLLSSIILISGLSAAAYAQATHAHNNQTFTNPVLPGWNSDPSCIFVKERDNTFFCTTSTFLAFPGIPVFASKDLVNWKLASNALNRREQLPDLATAPIQKNGIYASTMRYRDGLFYIITSLVNDRITTGVPVLLFITDDPYDDASWRQPTIIQNPTSNIDPDLFWDNDGKAYMAVAGGPINEIDITTGAAWGTYRVWNGTGGVWPEGPHIYYKDNYYYLMISEGGTETNHTITIARSDTVRGLFVGYESNPLLTAKSTSNYFQTVGHADFFQDVKGNWWAMALATRSGPEWEIYPMGRETVLFAMTWDKGGWPVLDPVQGKQRGPLPPTNRKVPGNGHWVNDPDVENFRTGSSLPRHWVTWRPQDPKLFTASPKGHPNTLRVLPSFHNLTATEDFIPEADALSFISRKQAATLFDFTVDLDFAPKVQDEEAGVTLFLTQFQHIDLGLVQLPSRNGSSSLIPQLRFRVEASGKPGVTVPETVLVPLAAAWRNKTIRLSLSAVSDEKYVLGAALASKPKDILSVGSASALIVSGGTGPFTGAILGVYATSNGGQGKTPAYFSRWRYTPVGQKIDHGVIVPA
ncbi:glycosyl hydrolase [Pterulicium gracile]|uniref:Glycosyl hydrolase n=1 Tax=Pterulicium gracile TaxID=1884261 RepID=A0A5C3QRG0_9AGAR|nr:glycosyl hydrolase [Pterula gracilis]